MAVDVVSTRMIGRNSIDITVQVKYSQNDLQY